MNTAPKCNAAGCAAPVVRYLPGKRRTFYCGDHGPTGRLWTDLRPIRRNAAAAPYVAPDIEPMLASLANLRASIVSTIDRATAVLTAAKAELARKEAELADAYGLLDDATRPDAPAAAVAVVASEISDAIAEFSAGSEPDTTARAEAAVAAIAYGAPVDDAFESPIPAPEPDPVKPESDTLPQPVDVAGLLPRVVGLVEAAAAGKRHATAPASIVATKRATREWSKLRLADRRAVARAVSLYLEAGSVRAEVPGSTMAEPMRRAFGLPRDASLSYLRAGHALRVFLWREGSHAWLVGFTSRADRRIYSKEGHG